MQVRAGKGLHGEELALPSAMGLSLDAMIHVMRRRKVLAEAFKVNQARGSMFRVSVFEVSHAAEGARGRGGGWPVQGV